MDNRNSRRGPHLAVFIYFGLTSAAAIVLLIMALVIWLSQVTGSLIASTLIIGGFFAVLSYVIYLLAIREAVERMRAQLATIYEVARVVQTCYDWVADKILFFMNLRGERKE